MTSRRLCLTIVLLTLTLAGCQTELDTAYGLRRGSPGEKSLNGTAVLAEMFAHSGYKVTSRRSVGPTLMKDTDVIVWFSHGMEPPTLKVSDWLDKWLAAGPDRTLIYVGRDYDAEAAYLTAILPLAPPEQKDELRARRGGAMVKDAARRSHSEDGSCEWFDLVKEKDAHKVRSLSGPWSEGVDAEKAAIELGYRFDPESFDFSSDTLLSAGDDVLVQKQQLDKGGQLIMVINGSFLLNYPLINHEHRKLAARLVAETGKHKSAVFLEAGPEGPSIREEQSASDSSNELTLFTIWPLNLLLLHLAVLGIVFCAARWPIFGRPKAAAEDAVSDFGRHVEALGELLEVKGDQVYARTRVESYQQAQRGDSPRPGPPARATTPGR